MDEGNFIFPPGLPDELKERLIRAHDQHEMTLDSMRHDVARLFSELPEEQLKSLKTFFQFATHVGADMALQVGMAIIDQHLEFRFGICSACGKDHSKELLPEEMSEEDRLKLIALKAPDDYTEADWCLILNLQVVQSGLLCAKCQITVFDSIQERRDIGSCPGCELTGKSDL